MHTLSAPPSTVRSFKSEVAKGFRNQDSDATLVWTVARRVTFPTGAAGFHGEGIVSCQDGTSPQKFLAVATKWNLTVSPIR